MIDDWADGDTGTDLQLVRDVIDAWQSGSPVGSE